jgi:isopentenyl diphosphate isomerase/L-lactate dehydrogenase-like FMN-dependent dehydrogenase
LTMHENLAAFREVSFRPRMATGPFTPDMSASLFGDELRLPVVLAPCGLVRLMHPDSGAGAARAAAARGTVSVLSTVAGTSLEKVATAAPGAPMWFQLYAGGRAEAEVLIDRAAAAGFGALVVTVDTPVLGNRERDVRNGVVPPLRIGPRNVVQLGPQILQKPVWAWRMARDGLKMVGAGTGRPSAGSGRSGSGRSGYGRSGSGRSGSGGIGGFSPASPISWSDFEWMRSRWTGPLLVKGLLTAQDAERAVACGTDGVIVSNHGGRQLEGAPATLRVLPEVVAAVGNRTTVLVDGGVRRGSDVVKAIALGARAVLVGRPYLYGLAASGEAGVERVLEILEEEMSRTMALLGCRDLASLDASWLQPTSPRALLEEDSLLEQHRDALATGDASDGLSEEPAH